MMAAVFGCGTLLYSVTAQAQQQTGSVAPYPPCEEEPSDSDVDAAKGAFQAGRISFEEADYDRAILYWEDAFRRDCTAVKLLLNVARAYELDGQLPHAIVALETYLARDPEIEDRETVEKRVQKLKARVEKEQRENAPEPSEHPASSAMVTVAAPPMREDPRHPPRPVWPVVTTAAGVAGLAVGTTFAVLGQKAVGDEKDRIAASEVLLDQYGDPVLDPTTNEPIRCTRKGLNWECPPELKDQVARALDDSKTLKRARTERTVGIVVAAGGVALTAVGTYFWATLWSQKPQSSLARWQPALVPVFAHGYRGLSFVGRF